jgi:epsilon-lactone hydrolase
VSKQQLTAIPEMSGQNPMPASATPAVMRAWVEAVASHLPVAGNVQIEQVNCGPCDGDLILPASADASRLIILYHGGGFLFGSSRTHRVIASHLARAAGSAVLVPDYRLAPENPAPTAHEDAFAVYQWALKRGYASGKVALYGDSSGGNLALATAVRAKAVGLPQRGALTLVSPWLDLAREGASDQATPDDPVVSTELLELFTLTYHWRWGSQVVYGDTVLFGLHWPAPYACAGGDLGKAARRFGHGHSSHEGSGRSCRPKNLRWHVPQLAPLRADAR